MSRKINLLKNKASKTNRELITVVTVSRAIILSAELGPLTILITPKITASNMIKNIKLNN